MEKKPHKWSGWPGAHCLDCGVEHALENAMALDWYEPVADKWISKEHREMVMLCDGFCYAKMTTKEITEHKAKVKKIQRKIDGRLFLSK